MVGPLVLPFLGDRHPRRDRVANEDGFDESQPVIAVREGDRIDGARGHADGDAEYQGTVGDPLPELLGLAPLRVHVVRVEVAGLPSVQHDVGFGDRPPQCQPLGAQLVLLEVALLDHRSSLAAIHPRIYDAPANDDKRIAPWTWRSGARDGLMQTRSLTGITWNH